MGGSAKTSWSITYSGKKKNADEKIYKLKTSECKKIYVYGAAKRNHE